MHKEWWALKTTNKRVTKCNTCCLRDKTKCKVCTALNLHTSLFVQQSITRVLGRLRVVAKKIFPLGEGIVAVHCLFLLSSSLWWLYEAGTRWVISTSKLGRSKHLVLVGAGWEAGLFRDCFVEILGNYKVQKQNVKMWFYDKTTYFDKDYDRAVSYYTYSRSHKTSCTA